MYAILCVIEDIICTLYNNLYYLWLHMHYIHSITRIIYDISSTLYGVTFTMCVTSHNGPIYGINHYMFMIHSHDISSGTVLWPHIHCVASQHLCLTLHLIYFWHYTKYNNFFEKKWMYVITASICVTPYAQHMASHPLFMTSPHCSYHIISTELMTSHTQYVT